MKTLITPLNLTTTSLVLGLIAFNISSAQAMSWTRTVTSSIDNYSDTRNPTTNFGNSNFLSIGRSPTNSNTSSQTAYVDFNLQSIINEVNAISPTAFITNVRTQLVFQQTNTNTANPNNPPGVTRKNPNITRVSNLQGFEVTGNFSESQAINPASPPTTSNVSLFTSQIQQGRNTYIGRSVNQINLLDQILENRLVNENPNFSIALRAITTQNFPSLGVFPIDDLFSQNSGANNPNCPLTTKDCRPRLELTFDVFDQGFEVPGGPNFKVQGRAGGTGTYEAAFLRVNASNQDVVIAPQANWSWGNGTSGNSSYFRLTCNNNTASLFLSNTTTFGSTPQASYTASNNCNKIEGLGIFASAQLRNNSVIPGASVGIIVNCASQINNPNCIPVTGLSATANAGPSLVPDVSVFTNPVSQGGLGFTQGADVIEGRIVFSWPTGNNSPNPLQGGQSSLQVQLIPLTRINDPRLLSQPSSFIPASVPEPTSVISLFLLGTLGTTLKLRKNSH